MAAVDASPKSPVSPADSAKAAGTQVDENFDRSKILLSDEDINEFREIFNLIDLDKSGCISTDELKQLVESVGMKLTDAEFMDMVTELDEDGSGEIDFGEFLTTMSNGCNAQYDHQTIRAAFQTFSRNAPPGLIRINDLYEALTVYMRQKDVDHREIHDLLRQFEDSVITLPNVFDANGVAVRFFKFDDYINLMMSGSSGSRGKETPGKEKEEKEKGEPQMTEKEKMKAEREKRASKEPSPKNNKTERRGSKDMGSKDMSPKTNKK